MKIEVLGSGCTTCKKLYELTQEVVSQESIEAEVVYVSGSEGIQKLMEMGAMGSPVLAVNGEIVLVGLPSREKLISVLTGISQ